MVGGVRSAGPELAVAAQHPRTGAPIHVARAVHPQRPVHAPVVRTILTIKPSVAAAGESGLLVTVRHSILRARLYTTGAHVDWCTLQAHVRWLVRTRCRSRGQSQDVAVALSRATVVGCLC